MRSPWCWFSVWVVDCALSLGLTLYPWLAWDWRRYTCLTQHGAWCCFWILFFYDRLLSVKLSGTAVWPAVRAWWLSAREVPWLLQAFLSWIDLFYSVVLLSVFCLLQLGRNAKPYSRGLGERPGLGPESLIFFVFPSVLFGSHFLLLSLILLVCKLDFKCAVTSKKLLF